VNFDLQPTLTGNIIEVRTLEADDFDALCEAAGDPMIWEQHPESDRYKRKIFQRYFDGAIRPRRSLGRYGKENGPPAREVVR
jgi:hypothetical protein